MDKVKRERSANFTLYERDILVSLIQKYQTVLENKQSDGCTWKKKEAAWESIKNEFNARSGAIFRSTKTLKVKYEGLKRMVRKKSAAIRSELYQTGGKWDVTSRRYLKSRKHPSLIADTPKNNLFNELTQAKLELVELQKGLLEAEIVEKKKVWEFEEKERAKESQFREKERQWKEEEYRLKLEKLRK